MGEGFENLLSVGEGLTPFNLQSFEELRVEKVQKISQELEK